MTRRVRNLMLLYVALLLGLAALGAGNQSLYRSQADLIDQKEALALQVTEMRVAASKVNGTLAVRQWAYKNGMVSAPRAADTQQVVSRPAPLPEQPETGLEVQTLWR